MCFCCFVQHLHNSCDTKRWRYHQTKAGHTCLSLLSKKQFHASGLFRGACSYGSPVFELWAEASVLMENTQRHGGKDAKLAQVQVLLRRICFHSIYQCPLETKMIWWWLNIEVEVKLFINSRKSFFEGNTICLNRPTLRRQNSGTISITLFHYPISKE